MRHNTNDKIFVFVYVTLTEPSRGLKRKRACLMRGDGLFQGLLFDTFEDVQEN